ncbi:MAG: hypothetical protein HY598_02820 [Candidatus Omnitrophica bacterium]|nr:hypothetical protein [Candidatus Omnitrophota bacterium]
MKQTVSWGPHAAVVAEALNGLKAQRVLPRLWERDASLWSTDPQVQTAIRNRLGWLTIADVMKGRLEAIRGCADEIRNAGFTHALLLGMGGSGLFSEVCRYTFGVVPGYLQLTVLDTTDPAAVKAAQQQCPLQQLLVIVSSKSGSTAEVSALSKYFYEQFRSVDANPGSHCVVITDEGTSLEAQANTWRSRHLFTHGPATGADVGGRFSALTQFGLVPAALIGADIGRLLERTQQMARRCSATIAVEENPAAVLGAALGAFAQRGRDKLTLLCSPTLSSFGTWVEQLVAENLGKQGKGIAPILGEPPRPPSAYSDDRVFVALQFKSQPSEALARHAQALAAAGHPVISIAWDDAYDVGGEVIKWELGTAIAGAILEINAFDEPNVKESKDRTKALLAEYAASKRLPPQAPLFEEQHLAVYGAPPSGAPSGLGACVASLLQQVQPRDYLAVLSFLPRTEALDGAVHALRVVLAERLPNATMIGFGPRYLHSTGQLFKGGPASGIFLLLTADDPVDLPIPGEAFGFSILKHAQALGDFQAMQEKGRRLLRVHLRGDLEAGLQRLQQAIREALSRAPGVGAPAAL